MRRPVVVAVDGSEASLRAAEWAAREAAGSARADHEQLRACPAVRHCDRGRPG